MRAAVRLEVAVLSVLLLVLGLVSCQSRRSDEVHLHPAYAEPVVLSSRDGVLDVTLNAHQDSIALNTVANPVANALVFGYRLNRGEASDGRTQNASNYPGPTLHVQPGDRLVIRMENNLQGLTIRDFLNPATIPAGQPIPEYPAAQESSPINLHTHGLHVSPKGNADNVLLDIPAGAANVYTYQIPEDHPHGLYWYHPHRHMETDSHVDSGLAGMLVVGRADGNLPLVTEHQLPVRTMALQNNFVFNRSGGGNTLNRADWPQYGSTLVPPEGNELRDGTYRPSLAPVNFAGSPVGTTFATSWFAGPLSPKDKRGNFQIVPQNLQTFTSDSDPSANQSVNRELPDSQRDVQFTVNGQFQPSIAARPGQTEIWVLANVTSHAFMNVAVRQTATGKLTPLRIVGVDGDPTPAVIVPTANDGTTLLIPPAQRYAIAVTMPAEGGLQLEMPPVQGSEARYTQPITLPGIKYTANGTDHPGAVLGTISMDLADISWNDGFLTFPTQKLLSVDPAEGTATPVAFEPGQKLGGSGDFVDTATMPVAVNRKFTITGAFSNASANDQYKRSFFYNFNDYTWPNGPLIQPRLGSVEQWEFISAHHDQHPTHIHVNDFQVMKTVNPVQGITTGVQAWEQDPSQIPGLLPA
ncbi:MAG: copper oxidase, partial [Mycobacterium sp.]|nr:copper oxidase [Mycobacterium sp.]